MRRELVLVAGRSRAGLEGFARSLPKDDEVVLEATGNAMAVVRVLSPFVARVIMANPLQVKAIADAHVKTEVIERRGPWRSREAVELASLEWVEWFNTGRLLGPIGFMPPAEAEAHFNKNIDTPAMAA